MAAHPRWNSPLAEVLASMELIGFSLDTDGLTTYGQELESQLTARAEEIYELAGGQFNINSPMQLGNVLFEKLGLPHGKKTQRGYSTNADVLESLRDKHPIIDCILDYRKLAKLKNTYVDGLLKVVGADGRVHSIFKQTETRTGRISSAEPNLQNIPVRTDEGSVFRKFFFAAGDHTLVDADYSQIELRVLAHIARDENMIEGFRSGADIHTQTAAQVFGMPPGLCHQSDAQPGQGGQLRPLYTASAPTPSPGTSVSPSPKPTITSTATCAPTTVCASTWRIPSSLPRRTAMSRRCSAAAETCPK